MHISRSSASANQRRHSLVAPGRCGSTCSTLVVFRIEHGHAARQLVVEAQQQLLAHLSVAPIHRAQMIADVADLIARQREADPLPAAPAHAT